MLLNIDPSKKNGKIKYRGIYSINFSNGKRYIGLSNNISQRYYDHYSAAKNMDLLPVHIAMRKYSYELELLEDCGECSREELCKREKYWIAHYNTFGDKNKGYNLTPGGDGGAAGINNPSAKLNEKQIQEVYDKLMNHKELYIYQIAAQYDISPEAISNINNGKRYYNEFLSYPLRDDHWMPEVGKGLDNHLSKFNSQQEIDNIYDELEHSNLTLREIAKEWNVSYATISKINRGLEYQKENYVYPVRKEKRSLKLSYEEIDEIYSILLNEKTSLKKIGELYNVSQDTIIRLNKGETYKKDKYLYPLRKNIDYNKAVSTILESEE